MIQRKKDVDGDLWIPGSITVLGGINSSAYRKTVTRVATTESEVTTLTGQVADLAEDVEGAVHPPRLSISVNGISRSRSGVLSPSVLTVSAAYPDGTPYAGRFVITVSHDGSSYVADDDGDYTSAADESSHAYTVPATMTVSTVEHYVSHVRIALYESGGTALLLARAECDVYADGSTTALYWGALTSAPSTGIVLGDYYFDDNVPASGGGILRYYTGATPWPELISSNSSYTQSIITAMPDIAAWATTNSITSGDTLAAATAVINNLVSSTAYIQNLFAQSITVPDGGRIQYETGSGVQKRAVRLHDEKIDWVDIPDTSPASPEQLRFRLGRLGVGGAVLADGELLATCDLAWSSETVIDPAINEYSSLIQAADGTYICAHRRYSDTACVLRTSTDLVTWSAASVISADGTNNPTIRQISDGSYVCIYLDTGAGHLKLRTSADLVTWSAEATVNAALTYSPTIEQGIDGVFVCVYRNGSTGHLVLRTSADLSTWSSESTIKANSEYPSLIQAYDGTYVLAYWTSGSNLVLRTSDDLATWSSESAINAATSTHPSIFQLIDGSYSVAYYRQLDGYLVLRTSPDLVTWSAESVINAASSEYPSLMQSQDGTLVCTYRRVAGPYYLVAKTLQRYARVGAGIVESGSNANGSYVKFSDGTMLQRGTLTYSSTVSRYTIVTKTLPVTFVDWNYTIICQLYGDSGVHSVINWARPSSASQYSFQETALDAVNLTATTKQFFFSAIGRWY